MGWKRVEIGSRRGARRDLGELGGDVGLAVRVDFGSLPKMQASDGAG